jgi:hypothetical protein
VSVYPTELAVEVICGVAKKALAYMFPVIEIKAVNPEMVLFNVRAKSIEAKLAAEAPVVVPN